MVFTRICLSVIFYCSTFIAFTQFEGNATPTYSELIETYKNFAQEHQEIELFNMGTSDYGLPIYLCIINGANDSLLTFAKARNSTTVFINNGIHAGEPDGINASLIWIQNWIREGKKTKGLPVIAIIPAYNVGGMMNRSSTSRANQNGPEEYGFRGNAQNLDLNRDFIKMDSKNTITFAKIFHAIDPDVFIDTHVSNGADYPYILTYIAPVKDRLAPSLSDLIYQQMIPDLTDRLKKEDYTLYPYIDLLKDTPDKGLVGFNDLARYSSGYATLFNTIGITLETHMLKPFPDRVKATLSFLNNAIYWSEENKKSIEMARKAAFDYSQRKEFFEYDFQLSQRCDSICFVGFDHSYPKSEISNMPRLKYHPEQIYEKDIPYFESYEARRKISIPPFFVIGGQCSDVIDRLRANQVEMKVLSNDTSLQLIQLTIEEFETYNFPYEGHYPHHHTTFKQDTVMLKLKKGDVLVSTDQRNRSFLLSVLIPDAEDSYFNWNFFDAYLGQKEHYSAYIFEDYAAQLLKTNSELKKEFEQLKSENEAFRNNPKQQLDFLYKRSDFFEKSYKKLPIFMGL